MIKNSCDKKGFSLVEMMVTLLIFFLIVSGMYAMTIGSQSIWEENKTRIDISQNLRKSMESMSYDLRQAAPSTITDVLSNGTWYTVITFKKPYGISGGALVWNSYTTRFILGGADSTILQKIENGVTTNLATGIKLLRFRRLASSPRALEVYVQGEGTSARGRLIQRDITFSVQLRNNP